MKPLTIAIACVAVGLAASEARADGEALVVPTALLQLDAQGHPQDEEGNNGLSIARMRLGVWSRPIAPVFALAQAEFADPEHPVIQDGFVRLGPWRGLRLSLGYFRSPLFASARDELDGMAPLPELSMPTRAMWPNRDLAVELHYAPQHAPIEAWARMGNGASSPLQNDNDSFAYTGRLDATFGRGRWDATGREPFGLRVGVGALTDDAFDRAGVGGSTASKFLFYRPPIVSGRRSIVELHVVAYAGPVRALLEVAATSEARSASTTGNPNTPRVGLDPELSRGGSIELAWMVTGERRLPAVWPAHELSFAHPAVEFAARAERLDVGRGMRDVKPSGATGGNLAVNVWLNALLCATVAGWVYHYDEPPLEEKTRHDSWLALARVTMFLNPPPVSGAHSTPPLGALK